MGSVFVTIMPPPTGHEPISISARFQITHPYFTTCRSQTFVFALILFIQVVDGNTPPIHLPITLSPLLVCTNSNNSALPNMTPDSVMSSALQMDILNVATSSYKPWDAERKASFVSGSIAALTAISLFLGTAEARSGMR